MPSATTPYDSRFYAGLAATVSGSAATCVPLVMDFLAPRSVVDLGCGQGDWLAVFREYGVEDFLGIDGEYIKSEELRISASAFRPLDLTLPVNLDRRFDLAMSLEVAEHLPPTAAVPFVHSLTALAPAVLFSAAIPGQGGVRHVNEQWPWYWQGLFASAGYRCLDLFRRTLWQNPKVAPFYQQNLYLFVDPAVHGAFIEKHSEAQDTRLTLVQTYVLKNLSQRKPFLRHIVDWFTRSTER